MTGRGELEQKALQLITFNVNDGVLQSELWRKLAASSREGSRIAIKLEKRGLIRRDKELFGGRWTYRLYPNRKPVTITSISDCPCLVCSDNPKCEGWGTISPNDCAELTEWIMTLAGRENPSGEN